MREIRFRGKTLDGLRWVYGDLIQENSGRVVIRTNLNTWAMNNDVNPYGESLDVIPETVGQYTGLKDRNGKEIYEGDIIGGSNGSINGYPWPFTLLIKWNDAACGFNTPNWGYMDSTHYYEVVGNRWDNPELLEGEE